MGRREKSRPVLWLSGAIFFDFVHFVLHAMLRSRWRLLRALAWPHAVHHQWIDRELEVHWENQRRNIWCHIVPEYLTQLVFTGGVALLLPLPFAAVLAGLQTLVFRSILRARGLDLNHRPIAGLNDNSPFTHLASFSGVLHPEIQMSNRMLYARERNIYLVHGTLDWMFPIETAYMAQAELNAAGANLTFCPVEGLSHNYCRAENNNVISWFNPALQIPVND